MAWARAAVGLALVGVVALVLVSGGSDADPKTPAALPGMPAPFLGTAVSGNGRLTAAVDAYGDVVDLRPSPAGPALIDNPAARQAAGTVPADTGIVPRLSVDGGPALAFWHADSVTQRYLPGTNVVRTIARFGAQTARATGAANGGALGEILEVVGPGATNGAPSLGVHLVSGSGIHCSQSRRRARLALFCSSDPAADSAFPRALRVLAGAAFADSTWIAQATPLNQRAPGWAQAMYERSLLTLRALTDPVTGAVAAGARDGWAYVWPRDAATAALALASAGYRAEARRVASFLLDLELNAAARFHGDGTPVAGRGPPGDAAGWVAIAAQVAGLPSPTRATPWRNRPDYQEGAPGDYLANAIAATATISDVSDLKGHIRGAKSDTSVHAQRQAAVRRVARLFGGPAGLVRRAGDPGSGLDSAAAWAVEPFAAPALYTAADRSLLHLVAHQTRFGIVPSEKWSGGGDPWSAPTAWTAWAFAELENPEQDIAAAEADRGQALRLLADLRHAATPAGSIPERVGARTGVPASTTPLGWSHAFAILTLRRLWP